MDHQGSDPQDGDLQGGDLARGVGTSRRRFLGVAGAAGSAAALTVVLGASPAGAAPSVTAERAMILRVARAGSVFPLRLRGVSGAASARDRAISRLHGAQGRLRKGALRLTEGREPATSLLPGAERAFPASQLALARRGADRLIAAGLPDTGQAAFLTAIGGYAATAPAARRQELTAAVALAVRTVFTGADIAAASGAARQWLALLSIMHQRGTLPDALRERGIR